MINSLPAGRSFKMQLRENSHAGQGWSVSRRDEEIALIKGPLGPFSVRIMVQDSLCAHEVTNLFPSEGISQ